VHHYRTFNGPAPTTAAQQKVTTGTAIKTMLQLATPSTREIMILAWGYSVDAAQAGVVELLQTDVAATVTAHVASGLIAVDPNAPASLLTLGTAATGYTASAEGITTASRVFDVRNLPSTADQLDFRYQFTAAERPILAVSKFLRVRATFGTAVNMTCWVAWDE
jgi:hypothetical protein